MQIQENISLKPYNSFGIDVMARQFASFNGTDDLARLIEESATEQKFILGGGSNILFTGNYDGLVLKNEVKGIQKINEDDEFVYIQAGAGENWHTFVLTCIENNWGGVENLSLIPGNVGASPMQNIGAYGVEIKDVFHQLEAYHIHEFVTRKFSLSECGFGYRESVFKQKYRNHFVILNVTYRLRKQAHLNTSYGAIEQELGKNGC
jgi:UDP-N-acetylmuramate dehydrogenase